jgi:hypothetical protein
VGAADTLEGCAHAQRARAAEEVVYAGDNRDKRRRSKDTDVLKQGGRLAAVAARFGREPDTLHAVCAGETWAGRGLSE